MECSPLLQRLLLLFALTFVSKGRSQSSTRLALYNLSLVVDGSLFVVTRSDHDGWLESLLRMWERTWIGERKKGQQRGWQRQNQKQNPAAFESNSKWFTWKANGQALYTYDHSRSSTQVYMWLQSERVRRIGKTIFASKTSHTVWSANLPIGYNCFLRWVLILSRNCIRESN